MNLICILKYVPDVDNFQYDYIQNRLIRENSRLLLNPDDACAVAFALKVKASRPDTYIHIITMAPTTVKPHMEDLLRLGVDRGTILSDPLFAGSDTYVTSKILAQYLAKLDIDCLLSGTHAIDGDTSHVPSQLAEYLELNQMSGIINIDADYFNEKSVMFDVETEYDITTYKMDFPAILSISRESHYKLPYPKRQDLEKDVSDRLQIIGNSTLCLNENEVGLKGSPTRVAATYPKSFNSKGGIVVDDDDAGVDLVYDFLKEKGFL